MNNTVVRKNGFEQLIDELFNVGTQSLLQPKNNVYKAPVNIIELENGYKIDVMIPGIDKEAIDLSIQDNVLSIAYNAPKAEEITNKVIRKEFGFGSFKRTFSLDEHIDQSSIEAAYSNGILSITLSKKAPQQPKEIKVSIK